MKEKTKFGKNKIIILEIAIAIVLFGGLLLAKTLLNSNNSIDLTLDDQTVGNIKFKDFHMKVDEGINKLSVVAVNNSINSVKISGLVIKLYDKNNEQIMMIQIPNEIDIEGNGNYLIENQFKTDKIIASVEYEFN